MRVDRDTNRYGVPCIVLEPDEHREPMEIIAACRAVGAVRTVDGTEYVVELRPEVGPELCTRESLARSMGFDSFQDETADGRISDPDRHRIVCRATLDRDGKQYRCDRWAGHTDWHPDKAPQWHRTFSRPTYALVIASWTDGRPGAGYLDDETPS